VEGSIDDTFLAKNGERKQEKEKIWDLVQKMYSQWT